MRFYFFNNVHQTAQALQYTFIWDRGSLLHSSTLRRNFFRRSLQDELHCPPAVLINHHQPLHPLRSDQREADEDELPHVTRPKVMPANRAAQLQDLLTGNDVVPASQDFRHHQH
jgi:hypothetical protein